MRETKRRNGDGTVVSYLQLAHSERHPVTGVPSAKVIHSFGRADTVDRDALARLVASISRFLDPGQAIAAAHTGQIEVLDSRRFGGAWVLDQLWDRLGVGAALRRVAAGRRIEGGAAERVLFALVAQRALEPGSKLAATGWVAERVAIADCLGFSDDSAYAAMDFLLDALDEIAARIFDSVAHLLNLDVDIVFVDTTSTYWEVDGADEWADLRPEPEIDDGVGKAVEGGARRFGKSKDHRDDLPQVVIAMAVTRDGIPVRCWTFPGSESDQRIIRTVKDDLGAWHLRRLVWVADAGFASAANRAYLTRGGGHYIHAEKLRHTNAEAAAALARPGRYHDVADNLRVKEVRIAPGGGNADGARAERFVVCHNPDAAARDAGVRERLIEHLQGLIDGSDTWSNRRRDELVGSLKNKPGLRRLLRRTKAGLLRIDRAAVEREVHYDGKWLLRTSDLDPDRRGPGRRLQAAARRRTRLARLQELARAAPGLPPPRGPHPRPCPIMLAGTASHPCRRNPRRRHLAQPASRTGPHAPGHLRHRRRPRRPALGHHQRPEDHSGRARPARTAPLPRLHTHRQRTRQLSHTCEHPAV